MIHNETTSHRSSFHSNFTNNKFNSVFHSNYTLETKLTSFLA